MRTDVWIHNVQAAWAKRLMVLGLLVAAPVGLCHAQPGQVLGWGNNVGSRYNAVPSQECMAICAGGYHSLALTPDGTLRAWGENTAGQANVPFGNNYVAIAAGLYHSLALRADGVVVAWGDNSRGQCSVPRNTKFRAIAAGTWHSLGIRLDGSLVAWGWNESRQCDVPPGKDYVEVCGGYYHSLALKADGTIVGWGSDGDGQATPPEGDKFVHISAGTVHSLALKADGAVVAWGRNSEGQCRIPSGNDFVAIAAGSLHNLALRRDGRIEAWGQDSYGQCATPDGDHFALIAAGNFHSLALRDPRKQFPSIESQTAEAELEPTQPNENTQTSDRTPAAGAEDGSKTNKPGLTDLILAGQIHDSGEAATETLLSNLERNQSVPVKPVESSATADSTVAKPSQVKDPNVASQTAQPQAGQTPAVKPPVTAAKPVEDPNAKAAVVPTVAPAEKPKPTQTAPSQPVAAAQKQDATQPAKPAATVAEPNEPTLDFDDPASQGFAPSIYMGVIENAAPVYHFVSTTNKRHFCTISEEEKYRMIDNFSTAWKYQGIAFFAYPEGHQPEGARPVYQFWSDKLNQHFYTMDAATKDMMVKALSDSWKYQGVAWYAPPVKKPGQKK